MTDAPPPPAQPANSDLGYLLIAAAFAATPLLVLFGNLGGALQPIILIASLVVGIPLAWRRIKAGTNPTMTVVLLIGAVVLYAIANALVRAMMGSA